MVKGDAVRCVTAQHSVLLHSQLMYFEPLQQNAALCNATHHGGNMPSLRTTWRSALTRFLPTSPFLMMVGLVPVMLSGTPIHPRAPLIALSQVVASAVGFGLMLTAMRRRFADATPLLSRAAAFHR